MLIKGTQTWETIPHKVDAWGDGPWATEPDKAQWTDPTTGLPCIALRGPTHGAWCGYVGVHADHPLHGAPWNSSRVSGRLFVHGAVDYSAPCQHDDAPIEHRICHTPAPGEPDDVWWFGFACAKGVDYQPGDVARLRRNGLLPLAASDIYDLNDYCTLEYVQLNCTVLAAQLHAMTTVRNR
jgi:hypothetical protein